MMSISRWKRNACRPDLKDLDQTACLARIRLSDDDICGNAGALPLHSLMGRGRAAQPLVLTSSAVSRFAMLTVYTTPCLPVPGQASAPELHATPMLWNDDAPDFYNLILGPCRFNRCAHFASGLELNLHIISI